jgi:alkylation response protein AidB-like acyl-CoA dehydrogenase
LRVEFQGARVTSDGGLILVRELDERLGLSELMERHLSDSRRGKNIQLPLADLLGRNPGIAAMVNKLVGTELNHDLSTAAMEIMGDYSMLARGEEYALDRGFWPYEWMFSLGLVIGGGTSHIQKNIIAERGLKMPKGR